MEKIRKETDIPLAVGFGIKKSIDLKKAYQTGMDAAIIGSAVTEIIEKNMNHKENMLQAIGSYLKELVYLDVDMTFS